MKKCTHKYTHIHVPAAGLEHGKMKNFTHTYIHTYIHAPAAELERRKNEKLHTYIHTHTYIHVPAAELERRKNEKLREERVIEKVRNEAPELRELEQKLRAAYMNQVCVCVCVCVCV